MGFIASLIAVVVPAAMLVLGGLLFFYIFTAFLGAATSGPAGVVGFPTFTFALIPFLIIALAIVALIGFILFIIAMYFLSQYYNEPGIFRNIIYGIIIAAVGIASLIALLIAALLSQHYPGTPAPFAFSFLAVILAAIVIQIVVSVFFMRAFNKLSEKSGVDSFRTAGLLILIGGVTSIVFVGGIISWLAWIFAASGFRSLKPKAAAAAPTYAPPSMAPPTSTQNIYCPYCGAQISYDSVFCPHCGRQIQH